MYICRALQSSHLQPFLFKGQTFHLGSIMAELLNSLKEVQAYLTSQQKVLKTAGSLAACMDQQAMAWEAKIKTAKITASEAEDLLQVVAKGPWSEQQAELLGTAINQAVLGATQGAKPGKRLPQTMKNFQAYLTKRDMDILSSVPTPLATKMDQLASRCVQLGLMWPNETSIRHIVAVGIGAGLQTGECPSAIFEAMKEFKRVLRNMRSKITKNDECLGAYVVEYPNTPQDLAQLMATYHESDPPVPSFEPSEHIGLCQISSKISLRGNNKMLENGKASSSQSSQGHALGGLAALVPALQAAAAPGASENPLLALANVCQQLFQPQQPKEKHIPGLTFLKPKERKSVTPTPGQADSQETEGSPRVACPEGPASSKQGPEKSPLALALPRADAAAEAPAAETALVPAESPKKAGTLKLVSPERMVDLYQNALKKRKADKSPTEQPPKLMKRPAAAPKACAAKSKAKAKAKAKAKSEPARSEEHAAEISAEAANREKPAATPKAKAKAKAKVLWTSRPPLPEPCSGTTYYLQGKIHRNTAVFRVFRKATDRVDLKVKVDPEPSVGWSRCLDIIEEAAKKEEEDKKNAVDIE